MPGATPDDTDSVASVAQHEQDITMLALSVPAEDFPRQYELTPKA